MSTYSSRFYLKVAQRIERNNSTTTHVHLLRRSQAPLLLRGASAELPRAETAAHEPGSEHGFGVENNAGDRRDQEQPLRQRLHGERPLLVTVRHHG